jgi:hypothetical protein
MKERRRIRLRRVRGKCGRKTGESKKEENRRKKRRS